MDKFNGTAFVEMIRQLGQEGLQAAEDLSLAIFNTKTEDGLPDEIVEGLTWLRGICEGELDDD
jgi:hypothetical protein